ncbi:MAG: DUF4878 domain-containing protein [Rikenellaceae bacterium]
MRKIKLFFAMLVAACCFASCGEPTASASDAMSVFFNSLLSNDVETYKSVLNPNLESGEIDYLVEYFNANAAQMTEVTGFKVVSESVNGDKAEVTYSFVVNGETITETLPLSLIEGKWYLNPFDF